MNLMGKSLKAPGLLLTVALLSGCAHVVQRQITVYPRIDSRAITGDFSGPDSRVLKIDGNYLQRAVLKFSLDDSAVGYVNRRLEEDALQGLHAVKIVDLGFSSKTKVWTLPLGKTTRFFFLEVEFERLSDSRHFRLRTELEVSVPPADHFLGLASRDDGIDAEILGKSMSAFVSAQFETAVFALIQKLKEPIQRATDNDGAVPRRV